MHLKSADLAQCQQWESELTSQYNALKSQNLNLDITRGKPSSEQLSLSNSLDGILQGKYQSANGTDSRNYGGLDGLDEAKQIGASLLGMSTDNILVGGNSSLTLMFQAVLTFHQFGFDAKLSNTESAWNREEKVTFICPVPGYDRHFSVTETFGIDMVTVPMTATGPDMDAVEDLIARDKSIRGMWCVPRFSNPTGVVYSPETVERIAKLGQIAHSGFRVFWDNAYAVHSLTDDAPALANLYDAAKKYQTEDTILQFASTSKMTHAGAGISFLGASPKNLTAFKKLLAMSTIGPDKINQLRHGVFLKDDEAIKTLMQQHATILRPRFDMALKKLDDNFKDSDLGTWESPQGGYFISFDAQDGCAKAIVQLAAEAGVKLTPAGATYPYGKDPQDNNIRIAPSVPSVDEISKAMDVFAVCVKLVSVKKRIQALT